MQGMCANWSVKILSVLVISSGFLATATTAATDDERRSTLDDQTALAVTIYNQDLALIKDRRKVSLPKGESRSQFGM